MCVCVHVTHVHTYMYVVELRQIPLTFVDWELSINGSPHVYMLMSKYSKLCMKSVSC